MKLRRFAFQPWLTAFVFLLFFTVFTRLFQLGSLPQGMSWDEVSLGYVGKMVVTTGRDEHGVLLPRVFQSFGDFKAPLAFYSTGIFTALFGVSAWSTRLPFALTGIGSVLLVTALCSRVFRNGWLGLLGGWMMAVSPWHLFFSRIAFESGLALFFVLLFLTSWVELREKKPTMPTLWLWGGMTMGIVGALYSYHAARLFVPLMLFALAFHEWRQNKSWVKNSWKNIARWGVLLVFLLSPLVFSLLYSNAGARAAQTTVFARTDSYLVAAVQLLRNWFIHLSFDFLALGHTSTLRHGIGTSGVFTWSQLVLLLLGISYSLSYVFRHFSAEGQSLLSQLHRWVSRAWHHDHAVSPLLWVALFLLGLFPATLGFEVPHPNRALLALAGAIPLLVLACSELKRDISGIGFPLISGCLILFASLEFFAFWREYTTVYPARSASEWMQGYQEAIALTERYRQEGKRIKFTSEYGEPAMMYAFHANIDPIEFRLARVPGVDFGTLAETDLVNYDVVVTSGSEMFSAVPAYEIERPDGSVAFRIYEKP